MPGAPRLLPPDRQHITTEGVSLMTFSKYLTIGRGNGQRSGWNLSHSKVGS